MYSCTTQEAHWPLDCGSLHMLLTGIIPIPSPFVETSARENTSSLGDDSNIMPSIIGFTTCSSLVLPNFNLQYIQPLQLTRHYFPPAPLPPLSPPPTLVLFSLPLDQDTFLPFPLWRQRGGRGHHGSRGLWVIESRARLYHTDVCNID